MTKKGDKKKRKKRTVQGPTIREATPKAKRKSNDASDPSASTRSSMHESHSDGPAEFKTRTAYLFHHLLQHPLPDSDSRIHTGFGSASRLLYPAALLSKLI